MEKNIKVRHNPHSKHRLELKKSQYNDSLKKYENIIPLMKKQNTIQTKEQNEQTNLKHFREEFKKNKDEIIKKEVPSIYLSTTIKDWEKIHKPPISATRYRDLKSITPTRNYLRKREDKNYHTPIANNRLIIKDDFNEKRDRNNKNNEMLSSPFMTTNISKRRINSRSPYNKKGFLLNPKRSYLQVKT